MYMYRERQRERERERERERYDTHTHTHTHNYTQMMPGLAMARSIGDDVAATVGVHAFPEVPKS